MKRLTLDQGARLREAFGSCTIVYECLTPLETCRAVEAEGCSVEEYVEIQMQAEEMDVERFGDDNDRARLREVRIQTLAVAKAIDREMKRA